MGCRWNRRGSTVKTPWVNQIVTTRGAVATAACDAEDGHELTADLYGKGHKYGEPHRLLVSCHPRTEPDGDVSRHPTFPEILDAADLLVPGGLFRIGFVACPDGVEREGEIVGSQVVQADQFGEAKASPLVALA